MKSSQPHIVFSPLIFLRKKKRKKNALPREQIPIPWQFYIVYLHFKNSALVRKKVATISFRLNTFIFRYCFERNTAALKTKETLTGFRLSLLRVIGSLIALVWFS